MHSAAQVDNLEYSFSHVLDRGPQRLPRSLPPLECVPPLLAPAAVAAATTALALLPLFS
jgi:hypothetical protein